MKYMLCLLLVAVVAVVVKADTCRTLADCSGQATHTHCTGDGWALACSSGYCTCSSSSSSGGYDRCRQDSDCSSQSRRCPFNLKWKCTGDDDRKSCHCRY